VGRLSHQKGSDLVAELVPRLASLGARLVMLSTGDPKLTARLQALARAHPERFAFINSFDEGLSHRIHAGADIFLMPSRFEPCGLNQMYAMNYGTPPVVHAVGGLRDTVADEATGGARATGFVFAPAESLALAGAVGRAVTLCRDRPTRWQAMMRAGMRQDFGWQHSARQYLDLYRRLVDEARA
jgi:starch synthase